MTLDMVGASKSCAGLFSSGGTESIMIAVLAYREWGRSKGIQTPEIVAGISAHPALFKACHYFGVKLCKVDICKQTLQLKAAAAARRVTSNTVMIYASAPTFSHGVVDPIVELGALAEVLTFLGSSPGPVCGTLPRKLALCPLLQHHTSALCSASSHAAHHPVT